MGGGNVEFDEAYEAFLAWHCARRSGERLRRLKDGNGHSERLFLQAVWWPTFHHFANLHPEYEIHDYKDGYRYLDFAYIQSNFRIAIEIDGFGPHFRNITTWQFDDHCQRQNHLIIDGWYVLRITYNQLQERPRVCQQTIQQLLGRWLASSESLGKLTIFEREAVRLATRSLRPITPKDVCAQLGIGSDYAQRLLRGLAQKQWLQPAAGDIRIRSYTLHPSHSNIRI